ncbi:MAG: hypothetical protein SGILL_007772 [Bacillariaceae sp.]
MSQKNQSIGDGDGRKEVAAPSQVNAKDVEAMLVDELNQLSVKDRENAWEEIHGVHASEMFKQDAIKLPAALAQMQSEIDRLMLQPENSNFPEAAAYRQALELNSRYILNATFRAKFIRADRYDAAKAAVRMIKFLNFGLETFGTMALMRPIQISDLNENAIAIIREGTGFTLPIRDPVGRLISHPLTHVPPALHFFNKQAQKHFYGHQRTSDDVHTQILGMVAIKFVHRSSSKYADDKVVYQQIQKAFQLSPVRMSAMHLCHPDTIFGHALKASCVLIGSVQDRVRVRFHVGSITECVYALKSFGIPTKFFPLDLKRRARDYQKETQKCLDQQIAIDQIIEGRQRLHDQGKLDGPYPFFAMDLILIPRWEDCLFGKGMPVMNHQGNVSMRKLLEQRWERYEEAKYGQKMDIAWEVIFEIKKGLGRFLREEPSGLYVEVDDETAREKISIAFRDIVRRTKKRQQEEHNNSQVQPHPSAAAAPFPGMFEQQLRQSQATQIQNATPGTEYLFGAEKYFGNVDLSDAAAQQGKRRKFFHGGCFREIE